MFYNSLSFFGHFIIHSAEPVVGSELQAQLFKRNYLKGIKTSLTNVISIKEVIMYIEEPKKNKNGELISHVYFTEEEAELLDEEDKKGLEPCDITIEPSYTATYQFKLPEGAELPKPKNYCHHITPTDEGFKVEWKEIDSEIMEALETAMFVTAELTAEPKGIDVEKEFGKEYVNKIRTNAFYKDFKARAIISKDYGEL